MGKNEDDRMPINVEKVAPVFFGFVVDAFVVKLSQRSLNKRNHVEIEGLTIYSYSALFAYASEPSLNLSVAPRARAESRN